MSSVVARYDRGRVPWDTCKAIEKGWAMTRSGYMVTHLRLALVEGERVLLGNLASVKRASKPNGVITTAITGVWTECGLSHDGTMDLVMGRESDIRKMFRLMEVVK